MLREGVTFLQDLTIVAMGGNRQALGCDSLEMQWKRLEQPAFGKRNCASSTFCVPGAVLGDGSPSQPESHEETYVK